MKAQIIFLDYFYFLEPDKAFSTITNQLTNGYNSLIACFIIETLTEDQIELLKLNIQQIYEHALKYDYKNFVLILNYPYQIYGDLNTNFKTLYYNTYAQAINNSYQLHPYKQNTEYNINSDKCLIVGGIPNRINRVTLISKLWKKGLLQNINYSLFPPYSKDVEHDCRVYTSELTDEEYNIFTKNCYKHLDDDYVNSHNYNLVSATENLDYTINKNHFTDSCISIVSETFFKNNQPKNDISEKTYRAIYNKHPFIIAGTIGLRKTLETYGFKTFLNYLKYDYDDIEDVNDRVDAIIENYQFFIENRKTFSESIISDIEYNYNILNSFIEQNQRIFLILKHYGLTQQQIDENISFTSPYVLAKNKLFIYESLDKIQTNETNFSRI